MSGALRRLSELARGMGDDPGGAYPRVVAWTLIALVVMVALVGLTSLLRRRGAARPKSGWPARLVYLAFLFAVFTLGGTAFFVVLRAHELRGLPLAVHSAAGGALVVTMALLALQWAAAHRFGRHHAHFGGVAKVTFWIALIAATVAAGSMLAAMFPWLDTTEMRDAIVVHRYAGLLLVVCAALHGWLTLLGRFGRS